MKNSLSIAISTFLVVLATMSSAWAQFQVSGTVIDVFTQPADSVKITLSDDVGTPIGLPLILTDTLGAYAIAGLPPGNYIVGFEPPSRHRLLTGTLPITIVASNVIGNITLDPGVLLSGTVTDTTGTGIFNIDLKVESRTTGDIINTPGDNTDVNGFYDVVVPADELDITWRAVDPLSLPWIPVVMRFEISADTTIDVTMIVGVFVSGIVRNHLGTPVANVNMDFVDSATGTKLDTNGDVTDILGGYQVQVPRGSYDVRAKPDPVGRLQGNEVVGVTISADTTMSTTVVPGILLSGTVTDPGFIGVEEVDIDVRDAADQEFYTAFSKTGLSGVFQFVVPSGVLGLTFEPPVATVLVPVDLPSVSVSTDTTLAIQLSAGVTLTGTVTQTSGAPVSGVDIDLRTVPGNLSVPLVDDRTDVTGSFVVVTAPGTYDIHVEPPLATSLVALFDTAVAIPTNSVRAWTVTPGAHILGTTYDPSITPISNVRVAVDDLVSGLPVFTPSGKSDAAGLYDIVVPISAHRVTFRTDPLTSVPDSVTFDPFIVLGDELLNVVFGRAVGTDQPPTAGVADSGLRRIYPNPFNPVTTIQYELSTTTDIDLRIIAVNGSSVRRLYRGLKGAGEHRIQWDGRSDSGGVVASGVYFVRLWAGGQADSQRLVLLK